MKRLLRDSGGRWLERSHVPKHFKASTRLMILGGSAIARGAVASLLVRLEKLGQRVLIAVSEARRVETTRSGFNDCRCDGNHIRVSFTLRLGAELGRADFLGGAHARHHQTGAVRFNEDRPLPA